MNTLPTTYSLSLGVSVANTTGGLKYSPIGNIIRTLWVFLSIVLIDIPTTIYYYTKELIQRR